MPDSLTEDQLELIVRSKPDWLLDYIEANTIFDMHQIRLILEMGMIEAQRRLDQITKEVAP